MEFTHTQQRFKTATRIFSMCVLAFMTSQVAGQSFNAREAVTVKTAWSAQAATSGQQLVLAVVLDVAEGYHIGHSAEQIDEADRDKVMPTKVTLTTTEAMSAAVKIGPSDFPAGSLKSSPHSVAEKRASHLTGKTVVYVPVDVGDVSQESLTFTLSVTTQACDNKLCFAPQTVKRELEIPVAKPGSSGKGCANPELFVRWSDRRSQKLSDKSKGFDYKSKQPPIGPSWVRDLETAQKLALKTGRPIFLYSTKTFCPHCVVVESEMLSSPKLKPYYDRAVWLYVYRDFKGGEADRRAERIGIRYSLSSWPQLWLIDPHTLNTIGEVGRSVEAFAAATAKTDVRPTDDLNATRQLAESESRVLEFEAKPSTRSAIQLLESDDVVAQLLAARYFTKLKQPEQLTDRAKRLLSVPNDALRYEVLNAIAATGKGNATELVAGLVKNPQPSRNVNVLRSHAIKALGACGTADSIDTIAPHAQGTARNMTTATAVQAMVQIAERHPDSQSAASVHLAKSFPPVEDSVARLVTSRAKQIHGHLLKLTGRELQFPKTYTKETRDALIQTWTAVLTF